MRNRHRTAVGRSQPVSERPLLQQLEGEGKGVRCVICVVDRGVQQADDVLVAHGTKRRDLRVKRRRRAPFEAAESPSRTRRRLTAMGTTRPSLEISPRKTSPVAPSPILQSARKPLVASASTRKGTCVAAGTAIGVLRMLRPWALRLQLEPPHEYG